MIVLVRSRRKVGVPFFVDEIVKTVIGIAAAVGGDVVADGVERPAERDALLEMGCRIGQGFYYSMPLSPEDLEWLLANRAPLPLCGA